MTKTADGSSTGKLVPIFIKLPPENIVSLKFTIESYEGLGIVRTLDPQRGEIVILALDDTEKTVYEVLGHLEQTLRFRIIPPPASLAGDWLLEEESSNLIRS